MVFLLQILYLLHPVTNECILIRLKAYLQLHNNMFQKQKGSNLILSYIVNIWKYDLNKIALVVHIQYQSERDIDDNNL